MFFDCYQYNTTESQDFSHFIEEKWPFVSAEGEKHTVAIQIQSARIYVHNGNCISYQRTNNNSSRSSMEHT